MKKIISMFLALVMALALAVPAMADDVQVEGTIQLPTINVVLPTTASVILNPYSLNVTLGKGETATTNDSQIISPTMYVKNLSDIGVQVAISVTGTKGKGSTAAFATAEIDDDPTDPGTTLNKEAFVFAKFVIQDDVTTPVTITASDIPTDDSGDGIVILSETKKEVTAFKSTDAIDAGTSTTRNVLAASADKKNPAAKGVLAFAFSGDAVYAPTKAPASGTGDRTSDPWSDKDTLGATVSFTFTPVPGAVAAAPNP